MMLFEWDDAKAESNHRKHGITFKAAEEVFYDPHALLEQDRVIDGEARWQAIGSVNGLLLLMVAHTIELGGEADEVIRIVSARKANRKERVRYEKARQKAFS
jgi:uncharacterized DUF497 family protein